MSDHYEAETARLFARFVERGFVYKGARPVYWCIHDQTALAEAEVEYHQHASPSVYVKFPLRTDPAQIDPALAGRKVFALIWTTTPWTLPANLGIAVHPDFEYVAFQSGAEVYIVAAELRDGLPRRPHLQLVLDAHWIQQRALTSDEELGAFGQFASLLVAGRRNRGEAAVLAYAQAHGALAVIDDSPGRRAAVSRGIACQGTLALLCEAVRAGRLTVAMISALADDLLEGAYRLPFTRGGFEQWATDCGLLPPGPADQLVRVAVRRRPADGEQDLPLAGSADQ